MVTKVSEAATAMVDTDHIKMVVGILHMAEIEMVCLLHLPLKTVSQHGSEIIGQTPDYLQDLHPPIMSGMMADDRIVLMATGHVPEILIVKLVHLQEE